MESGYGKASRDEIQRASRLARHESRPSRIGRSGLHRRGHIDLVLDHFKMLETFDSSSTAMYFTRSLQLAEKRQAKIPNQRGFPAAPQTLLKEPPI
jgi:hypothetical protein